MTVRSRLRRHRGPLVLLLVAGGTGLALWSGRFMIARPFVSEYLQARGIDARYRIDELTTGAVTLTHVSLGPPDRPEFTAARIRITWRGLREAVIERVTLESPVLRAAISADGFTMGSLDALMPASSEEPLPALDVRLTDAQLLLDTPWGALRMEARGDGVLRDGFRGAGRVHATELNVDTGCRLTLDGAELTLATAADHLTVRGEAMSPLAVCRGVEVPEIRLRGEARADPAMRRWTGALQVSAADASHSRGRVARPRLAAGFTGDLAQWHGRWSAGGDAAAWPSGRTGAISVAGTFNADASGAILFAGKAGVEDISLSRVDAKFAPQFLSDIAGRFTHAAHRFAVSVPFSGHSGQAGLALHVPEAQVDAASGARLIFDDGGLSWISGQWSLAGNLTLAGGGLPEGRVRMDWRNDRFSVAGQLRYSGVAGDGLEVDGLVLDAKAEGRTDAPFSIAPGCMEAGFRAVRHGDARLDSARLSACPDGKLLWQGGGLAGTLTVSPVKLRGHTGDARQTFALETDRLRLTAGERDYTMAPAKARLLYGDTIAEATLSAHAAGGTLTGRIKEASLSGAALPVQVDAGEAAWTYSGGQWRLRDGAVRVRDLAEWARFQPLMISDVNAHLAQGKVHARGDIGLARSPALPRVRLARFAAEHDLASARGKAEVDTGALTPGPDLQPYQITERLRGVIENVRGTVEASARLRWEEGRLAATGDVALTDVSLATAALGPAGGINGRVHFTDLLDIKSPPGQEFTIASINPGILVENGRVRFQLTGGGDIRVEQAQWPFSGGTLSLQPMLFDFDAAQRHFTLAADGLDAGLFLQGLDLKDINATGKFDGRLPLEFVDGRGRITDGVLTARAPGGLVSYTGNVGADQMGAAGEMAFDALRQLRYRQLQLKLNGDLDGELVTEILLEGTNENPVKPGGSPVEMAGLPFRFNISIRAPFRRLLGTAASFNDARTLIRSGADSASNTDGKAVQPR